MKKRLALICIFSTLLAVSKAQADFPSTINYQGRLVSGTNLVNEIVAMSFRLYTNGTGGSALFESTNSVLVVDGLYATEIGQYPVTGTLDEALSHYPLYLEVVVNGTALSPRERFTAVPYALRASKTDSPSQGMRTSITSTNGVETFYPSLTDAFDALESGQTLRLYPGEHLIQAHPVGTTTNFEQAGLLLNGKANIRIIGDTGSVIKSPTRGDFIFINNSHNIQISGITFQGLGPNPATSTLFSMINLRGTNSHITVQGCRFIDFGNHGVSHLRIPQDSTFVSVLNNHFENGGDSTNPSLIIDGAAISGIGSDWIIQGNTIRNCLRGIEIEGQSVHRRILIADNILSDIWNHGIMLYPSSGIAENYSDIIISGNTISGANPKPYPVADGNGILVRGGHRISIVNNIVGPSLSYAGIEVMSLTAEIVDCIITGNRVHGQKRRGIQIVQRNFTNRNCLVQGNLVTQCFDRGIIISGQNHMVIDNKVSDCSPYAGIGIHVYLESPAWGPTEHIFLNGNMSHDNKYGIVIANGVDEVLEGVNYLFNNSITNRQDLR